MRDYYILLRQVMAGSPFVPNLIRIKILRNLGWKIGERTYIGYGSDIADGNGDVEIGNDCHVGDFFHFDAASKIVVEDHVRIARYVKIITRTHPIASGPIRRPVADDNIEKPVTIGYGSWVGINVTFLPGADCAASCVVAAGSTVTGPTAPNGLYAGLPAKRIKNLPTTEEAGGFPAGHDVP